MNTSNPIQVGSETPKPYGRGRALTADDKAAAKTLRAMWAQHQRETGATQMSACDAMGMNQSSFSNYLREQNPIGRAALEKFSTYFGCAPGDIRKEFIPMELIQNIQRTQELFERLLSATKRQSKNSPSTLSILRESEDFLASISRERVAESYLSVG